MIFQNVQTRLNVHFSSDRSDEWNRWEESPLQCVRWKRRPRTVSRREKIPRAARHRVSFSFSLSLSRIYRSGTLRATLGAHVRRSIAHELEIYGTRARRWHGCTVEAVPRHAGPLLFCTSSSLTHLLDCAITRLSTIARKRDRGVHGERRRCRVDVGRRGPRCKGNDVYQLHPAHSNCRAQYMCSSSRIYLFVGYF